MTTPTIEFSDAGGAYHAGGTYQGAARIRTPFGASQPSTWFSRFFGG
jgi:hypothetical protein